MIELNVKGMTCGHCVGTVTRAVKDLDAAAEVKMDLASGRVSVTGRASQADVIAALDKAGYPATPAQGAAPRAKAGGCCGSCG